MVQEQIGPAVVIDIDPSSPFADHPLTACNPSLGGDIDKGTIPLVAIKPVGLLFTADEDIESTVAIKVLPSCGNRVQWICESSRRRHVGKSHIPLVAKQCRSHRQRGSQPSPPHNEHIEQTIVVEVGLHAVETSELVRDPRLESYIVEGLKVSVPIHTHDLRRIERGDHHVEFSIAVEIIHDRSTGLIQAIESDLFSDVAKPTDPIFLMDITIDGNPILRWNLFRVLIEGHVSHI